ncbi:ROK family protein [Shewanella sp. NIFS-20-20]|uniref:ROK family protein n=1 Tax=Shewanella sp. NIFS-20-20 TaxID=2853806 RepID=UPI001C493223|nr:ROK family protein [Shewanella sp. NIFS-20-20]MBV7314851.1 ROK family protein [Shewanella sp. NIFS-20-20]
MRIGIDLGGTKTDIIVLDDAGQVRYRKRCASGQHYAATLATLVGLIHEVDAHFTQAFTVGIGIPGTVSRRHGTIKNANSTWLIGQSLDADLHAAIGRPVRLANDANCFALSEACDGAGQGFELVFGVILGTGCGAGLVINGKVHSGINGVAGEWGHNPLPWMNSHEFQSRACYCGRHDCIETYISGTGLSEDFYQATQQRLSGPEIISLMQQQDSDAQAAFHRYCDRLCRALAHVVNLVDPDIIVLGGGMSDIAEIYPYVNRHLAAYIFGKECETKVVPNQHGNASGVRGAAWLWP